MAIRDATDKATTAMAIPETAASFSTGAGAPPIIVVDVRAGAGRFTRGWVGCILTVALGSVGFVEPSGGKVMRAVSFFGVAAFWVIGSGDPAAVPEGGGTGFSGIVGREPRPGGFGGGAATPAGGRADGTPGADGGGFGAGGGGMNGLGAPAGPGGGGPPAPPTLAVVGNFVVSFFGDSPAGGTGFPGTLIRTVSRFTAG